MDEDIILDESEFAVLYGIIGCDGPSVDMDRGPVVFNRHRVLGGPFFHGLMRMCRGVTKEVRRFARSRVAFG